MPHLDTFPVLLVILPLTFIPCSLRVHIDTVAIGLVVAPLSLIDVVVHMVEFSLTKGLPVVPFSIIHGAVLPPHDAATMAEAAEPFTGVNCTGSVSVVLSERALPLLEEAVQGFFGLILSEILA